MREEQIVYENGPYWVEQVKPGTYKVWRPYNVALLGPVGSVCSELAGTYHFPDNDAFARQRAIDHADKQRDKYGVNSCR